MPLLREIEALFQSIITLGTCHFRINALVAYSPPRDHCSPFQNNSLPLYLSGNLLTPTFALKNDVKRWWWWRCTVRSLPFNTDQTKVGFCVLVQPLHYLWCCLWCYPEIIFIYWQLKFSCAECFDMHTSVILNSKQFLNFLVSCDDSVAYHYFLYQLHS